MLWVRVESLHTNNDLPRSNGSKMDNFEKIWTSSDKFEQNFKVSPQELPWVWVGSLHTKNQLPRSNGSKTDDFERIWTSLDEFE